MKTYNIPAKIILLGEHAVVHGGPAIAVSLDKGLTLNVNEINENGHQLKIDDWDIDVTSKDKSNDIIKALTAIEKALPGSQSFLSMKGSADFPSGAGLGSSSALSMVLSQAVAANRYPKPTHEAIVAAAHKAETVFHDTPSGLDVSACSTGGFISYQNKNVTKLDSIQPISIAVGVSTQTRATKDQLAALRDFQTKNKAQVDKAFEAIGNLSAKALDFLTSNNWATTGKLMTKCHRLLASLGVSTSELDSLVEDALALGAFGAKLTGAGGGGSVIAVGPEKVLEKIVAKWKSSGCEGFIAKTGK